MVGSRESGAAPRSRAVSVCGSSSERGPSPAAEVQEPDQVTIVLVVLYRLPRQELGWTLIRAYLIMIQQRLVVMAFYMQYGR